MHLVLNIFIFSRTLVTYARTIFKPRCCLNFQCMRSQAESTYIAHNLSGQIKMKTVVHLSAYTHFLNRMANQKWQVASLLLCVLGSTNSASLQTPLIHPMLQICSNSCMGIARPVWTARTYNSRPRSPRKALSIWAVQQALERGCGLRSAWTTLRKVTLLV